MTKVKFALVAALVASTATVALARTHQQSQVPADTHYGVVVTDEGQGRFAPADAN
jgi:hypothetical protein